MTIAVTGGTGFVGQAVLDEACGRGLEIRALTRREQESRQNITWVLGDLHDHAALADLMQGVEAAVHIAGVVNAPDVAGFEHGNVTGTRNVLDAATHAGASRFICVSSLSAREPQLSDYGRSKRMAEQLVEASSLDWTLIRPPAIYGPRDAEMLDLFRAARWGIVPMPPEGRASIIHVDDLARLLLNCAAGPPAISRQIFEPDDGSGGWQHADLARAIGASMGRKVWAPSLPAALLKTAARFDGMLRGKKAKLTPDRARYMVHPDWVCSPDRKVPETVWRAQIETGEGLAQTARWYEKQGWV